MQPHCVGAQRLPIPRQLLEGSLFLRIEMNFREQKHVLYTVLMYFFYGILLSQNHVRSEDRLG